MVSLNGENGTYTVCENKPHFCCVLPEVFNIQLPVCFKGVLGQCYKENSELLFCSKIHCIALRVFLKLKGFLVFLFCQSS